MAQVLLVSFQLALGIVVPWAILRRDLSRASELYRDRAWNDASFWMSVVMFGPLCLPFHFIKTRRNLRGVVLGLVWTVVAFAIVSLVTSGLALLLGVE